MNQDATSHAWRVLPLEREVAYLHKHELMRNFTLTRSQHTLDELWPLEHQPVFTQGLGGKAEHVLNSGSIPVVRTERGGQVTYHGPGQLVVYILADLRRRSLKVKELVFAIEEALIETLAHWGLRGLRRPNAPGVYLQQVPGSDAQEFCKIAALGLEVNQGCSWHGVALNVDMDLDPYLRINPCGYQGLRTIDMATLGLKVSLDTVTQRLTRALCDHIDRVSALDRPLIR